MVEYSDLVIPVYLNQRVVFDLVAVLEGGIASVTQISQTLSQSKDKTEQINASFGLNKALSSLLKIDLSGKQDKKSSDGSNTIKTEDRIHTPVSLFITLRSILHEKKYLKKIEEDTDIEPGDIVEFSSTLNRNPLIETLESFVELIDMMKVFEGKSQKTKDKKNTDIVQIKKQMESLLKSLTGSDTLDLTTPALLSSHRAVISIEKQNLNDPSMSDLVDGTFRVVGKVTRVIKESEGTISLNRKSAFNRLPSSALEQFKNALQDPKIAIMGLPELEWEIKSPALQVLPIAIFT